MGFTLEPPIPAYDLVGRLAALRRRLRQSAIVIGGASLVTLGVGLVLLAGLLDAALHLPAPLRALILAGVVFAVVWGMRRWVRHPWRRAGDDLTLALAVQRQYPGLHDALASAVHFTRLGDNPDEVHGSPGLREAAVRYAVARTARIDFTELADGAPTFRAATLLLTTLVIAALLAVLYPSSTLLCLARLGDPYGDHPWPPNTRLTVDAPAALPRGEAFVMSARLEGVIPDRAVLNLVLDGAPPSEQVFSLTASASGTLELPIKVEPARVPRDFRYRLTANDGTTGWREVAVSVPPQLTAIDGRPSPRLRLEFPLYTNLPSVHLPDGAGAIECIAGTAVVIRAATDRPIVAARLVLEPRDPRALASIGGTTLAGAGSLSLGTVAAAAAVSAPIPLAVDATGRRFSGRFTPTVGGIYELEFVDSSGLAGRRALDMRLVPDPSPGVALERPSASLDPFDLVPGSTVTLRATIDDPTFAVRAVAVEYAINGGAVRRHALYDGAALGRALPHLLSPLPLPATKLRPTHLEIERRLPLDLFVGGNGKPPQPGDVLALSVVAADFDDVSPDKPPGHSHEVELRIVSTEKLDAKVQEQRARLAKSLDQLHKLQAEALASAQAAERQRRATGALAPADLANLASAEARQQQVQDRLNDEREGAIAQAERLRQTVENRPTADFAEHDRAQRLVTELQRIAGDVVSSVGPQLAAARKEKPGVPPEERLKGPLPDAIRRQSEAERSLGELVGQARDNAAAAALAAEAATLANEQQQLNREREQAAATIPPGADPARLPEKARENLGQLKERQGSLAKRAAEMNEQLGRRAAEAHQTAEDEAAKAQAAEQAAQGNFEPATAAKRRREAHRARERAEARAGEAQRLEAARDAARQGDAALPEQMNRAAQALGNNQLGEARQRQEGASRQLDAVREALRPSPEQEVDRLTKERRRVDEEVNAIRRNQESLQDRTLEAGAQADPVKARQERENVAREQDALAERARQAAQELHRQGQADAATDLERAARDMERARDELAGGREGATAQDDALDRLDDAASQTARSLREAEEHLQREKFVKLAVKVKGLAERQASLGAEGQRLLDAAQSSGWSRSRLMSLADLARDEQALAKEVEKLTADSLQQLKVLKRVAEDAAEAMNETAVAIEDARAEGLTAETIDADRAAILTPQRLAAKRLHQLQTAVAPPKEKKSDAPQSEQARQPTPKPGEGSGESPASKPETDGVPALAQLVVLRDLQAEINERTVAFGKDHPDSEKWTPAQRRAIDRLRRTQAELAALLLEMTPDNAPPERQP